MIRRAAQALVLAAALALAACSPEPQEANPALWRVDGPAGERAWLFGTIHSLPRPAAWRTPAVDRALGESDRIVVEIAGLDERGAMQHTFAMLATTPGQPPLGQRIDPGLRPALMAALDEGGMSEDQFAATETWAAALTLSRGGGGGMKSEYGVDRAVIAAAAGRPVVELEGTAGQLRLFDRLPETEQRDLLAAIVRDANSLAAETGSLAEAWRTGRIEVIERETKRGLLADPELRAVLFTGRNRDWSGRIAAMLARGERPFVAVGAAHMAGPEGVPAMLQALGYKVTRVE